MEVCPKLYEALHLRSSIRGPAIFVFLMEVGGGSFHHFRKRLHHFHASFHHFHGN